MNKTEMLDYIKDNMYWGGMMAYVWKDNNSYKVEIDVDNLERNVLFEQENYIGKVSLERRYWRDTDGFDLEDASEDTVDYVNECILDNLGL